MKRSSVALALSLVALQGSAYSTITYGEPADPRELLAVPQTPRVTFGPADIAPPVPHPDTAGMALRVQRGFCYGAVPEHWYGSELRNRAHVWFCAALARGEDLTISPVTPRVPWENFLARRVALASGGDL